MKTILLNSFLIFQLLMFSQVKGQPINGDYGNEPFYEEIYFNGLALKPDNNFSQNEIKEALDLNSERTDWGIGIDWKETEITAEKDDYHGFLTSYNYKFLSDNGFVLRIQGYPNSNFQSVSSFSLQSSNIVVGFLNHKFIIGATKKEDVEGIFYNGKVEEEYKNGYCGIKVFTHGGKLRFIFNSDNILQSIYLESF